MKIIAFMASQRRSQWTESMLHTFLEGIGAAKEDVTYFYPRSLKVEPCRGCGACEHTGTCIIQDEMQEVYRAIEESDMMVIASPVYFNGVPAPFKSIVDRTQRYWAIKYKLGQKVPGDTKRPAYVLSCGGAPYSRRQFVGLEENLEHFFAACNYTHKGSFYLSNTDRGQLTEEVAALEDLKQWASQQSHWGPSRIQRTL